MVCTRRVGCTVGGQPALGAVREIHTRVPVAPEATVARVARRRAGATYKIMRSASVAQSIVDTVDTAQHPPDGDISAGVGRLRPTGCPGTGTAAPTIGNADGGRPKSCEADPRSSQCSGSPDVCGAAVVCSTTNRA